MPSPFEIEIPDEKRECFYKLTGTYITLNTGEAFDFKLNHKECSFRGFGGSVDSKLPEIALAPLEHGFSVQILDAINKMVDYENESANQEYVLHGDC